MNLKMKDIFVLIFLMSILPARSQCSWGMASMEKDNPVPTILEYHAYPEQGAKGILYQRIYDESYIVRQEFHNPIPLQYGFRMSDRKMWVYDFNVDEERLAFDFTLSAGDRFTTYNGMEWELVEAADTIVKLINDGEEELSTKRLLKVRSADGLLSDCWLEGFGSFSNHLMIMPMDGMSQVYTLWMEDEEGRCMARELSADPLFTHDSGLFVQDPSIRQLENYVSCTYQDGILTVEDLRWRAPNHEFSCFYRVGDELFCAYVWNLKPSTESDVVFKRKDLAHYAGLPIPYSGEYKIHFSMYEKPAEGLLTGQGSSVGRDERQKAQSVYDLKGVLQPRPLSKGIYIENGRKVCR